MKKFISFLRSNPPLFYLMLFLLMIVPSLLLFIPAEESSQPGMIFLIVLVALANLTSIFFTSSR